MSVRIEFDKRKMILIIDKAAMVGLRRTGAYIRSTARNAVYQSKDASSPGTPPHTRRGLLRNSLLFGVDNERKNVVIGPAASFIGVSMTAHEFGGMFRSRRYPKRALMAPTLIKALNYVAKLFENTIK